MDSTANAGDSTVLAKDSAKKAEVKPAALSVNTKGFTDYVVGGGAVQIGYVKSEEKEKVNAIIKRKDVLALFPQDMKFMWSANLEKTDKAGKDLNYILYAVKIPDNGKARVGGKDVKNASYWYRSNLWNHYS
jgi:SecD/SecF fusion protein